MARLRRPHPFLTWLDEDSQRIIGGTFAYFAILFGCAAPILPFPFGLAGLILGVFGFLLTPNRRLGLIGLGVAAGGMAVALLLGWLLTGG